MAKLKAKQIVDIQDSIFQQTGSVQSTDKDLAITGSLTVKDNIVDFTNATSVSGSTFSGSFVGSGAGLTGVPASGIDGQLGIFAQTSSFQSTTNAVQVTGSLVVSSSFVNFVGATAISGSTFSGSYVGSGAGLTGIPSSGIDGQLGIFSTTGSKESTTNDVDISGSLLVSASATSSTAIFTNNITNGYPTSNNWGENLNGSYFNNFDHTSHTSEILRFMAGIISHSIDTSTPTANTKTFASVDTNETNLGSTDTISGYLPTNYDSLSNSTLDYLVTKGWTSVGATIFNGISVYHDNGSSYKIDFDSNSGGSTSIRSSADTELFGLGGLTSGGATEFKVKVVATQSFSDVSSNSSPNQGSNTFTTQSIKDLSVSSFTTSNGLTLAKIDSANPAVIPPAFQDGKFTDVGGTTMTGSLTRKYHSSNIDFASNNSIGYYRFHDLKVGIASGSGNYQFVDGATKNRFWAPIDTIESAIGLNSLSDTETTHKALTATSRSLSGVPYLIDSTFEVSTQVSGLFNPMYASSTTLLDMTAGSVGVGSVSITGDTISTNGGTIQTSGKVFQSDGATAVNSGVPRYNDIAIVTASVSYDSGTSDSIQQSSTLTDTTFTVLTKARNREGTQSTLDTQTIPYHSASMFGQPLASGSLGIYGRAQGYDGGSLTGTTEQFSGEDFRIQLNNNVVAFNGDAFTTTFQVGGLLGNNDLQVKPGFLVDPGGSYRYWYPADYGTGDYKYYIRRFQDGSSRTSMTVNASSKTLVNWNSTSNGIAVGLILKSGTSAGSNTSISTCRIFDPSATTSNLIEAGISNDNHKNPFSSNIDLYGNTGGSVSSGTYTVPIRNADGMYLDSSDNELYVILRYKGDPSPVSTITLAFS